MSDRDLSRLNKDGDVGPYHRSPMLDESSRIQKSARAQRIRGLIKAFIFLAVLAFGVAELVAVFIFFLGSTT